MKKTSSICANMNHNQDFEKFINNCIEKFKNNNWGNSKKGQKMINQIKGNIIKAHYKIPSFIKLGIKKTSIMIVKEPDENETPTILFPSEY